MVHRIWGSASARSRWAGIGAAVTVSLGAGGIGLIAHAASSTPSSFVPITPCRLFDTRPDTVVGDRSTPLNAGEEFVRTVWGTNGNCTIPSTATAISYNLTVPTGINGYLTIYPADASRPDASSINPVAGEQVKANGGIVGLSATGAIKVFTLTGPVNALLDISGYFLTAGGGGSPGPAGPAGAAGPRGFSAWDVIASGQTVTGEIIFDTHGPGNTDSDTIGVDLPGVAPTPLNSSTVNFATASGAADADATCAGSVVAPTAPGGKVCIYLYQSSGITLATLTGHTKNLPSHSFVVDFSPIGTTDVDEFLYATWAYTAP